jgi:rifampicin phosphotransferase
MTHPSTADAASDAAAVGHKFARLDRMLKLGLPVPDFFCVPVSAFDAALTALAPPAGSLPARQWCAQAAQALREAPMPEWILTEIDTRFGPDSLLAVRACAVSTVDGEGEDGADPYAGMSDSFLYVPKDHVARRVAGCWASAFTGRLVEYRIWRGLDPTRVRMAVGIQLMVPGTRSFVAFTRDPRDHSPRTVIAAAHGIGEGVVAERADVDHFFVNAGQAVTSVPVHKRRMVVRAEDSADGTAVMAVPPDLADPPVLSEPQVREIASLAARVETVFGCPQDIEGTITADGMVHLVQARPMAVPAKSFYWGNHNITESYPGISSVLTFSQAREFYRRAFGDLYRRMGVPSRRRHAHSHHLEQLVGFLDGRIYYRLDSWQAAHGQMPAFELVRAVWEESMGVAGPARHPRRWSRVRALASLPGLLARMAFHPWRTRDFLRWWDTVQEEYADLDRFRPDELVDRYRSLWAQVAVRWGVTLTNSVYGMVVLRVVQTLLDRWAGGARRLLPGLLVGGAANRSQNAAMALVALSEQVAADDELRSAVLAGDNPEPLWRNLSEGRYGDGLARAAGDYVRRYGDRVPHDLKLEEPTARQRPWLVLGLIRPYLRDGLTVTALREAEAVSAQRARRELTQHCRGRLRRTVLRVLAGSLRAGVRRREDTRFCRTQLYGLSRDILWRLGAELARAGRIDDAHDISHLTVDEVLGSFDGTAPGDDLRALVALRRADQDRYAATPAGPALLATPAGPPIADALRRAVAVSPAAGSPAAGSPGAGSPAAGSPGAGSPGASSRAAGSPAVGSPGAGSPAASEDGGDLLRGLGSCAGVVRAPARLVLEPDVDADSCRGRILIARETDPGWLFLMLAARGLVAERGSVLSHTAVTGRLLGIPTVVAVPEATTRIHDGAMIEIDGTNGTVRLVEGA